MIRWLLFLFVVPVLASFLLNLVYEKPALDHGQGTMFDQIAHRYDFINRALALNMDLSWRKRMIAEITHHGKLFYSSDQQDDAVQVLDLATGTADVAILFAQEYSNLPNNDNKRPLKILGVDPSINMITVGRDKIAQQSLQPTIQLELGDARNLHDLNSNTFDAATMSFGIRNVPEKETALCEIHRVLKPHGAKLGILEFSEPDSDSGVLGAAARLFIRYVVPILGAILSGAPREYMHLQNSIKEFPSPQAFATRMESLKCRQEDPQNNDSYGTFKVQEVIQLNFGSVQLYLATPIVITEASEQ